METEEDYVAFVLCILCIVILRRRLSTRYRHVWSRDWLLRRQQHSAYHALLQELDREDPGEYANYLRINKETFDMLLAKIKPYIQIENTRMRDAIAALYRIFAAGGVGLLYNILIVLHILTLSNEETDFRTR